MHIPDNALESHPVTIDLDMEPDINLIATYKLVGNVGLVTCKPSGEATLNQIHADCLGWTKGADITLPANLTGLCPIQNGGSTWLLTY